MSKYSLSFSAIDVELKQAEIEAVRRKRRKKRGKRFFLKERKRNRNCLGDILPDGLDG